MSGDRWVVLALGHPRAPWFSEVAKWATNAAIPVDVVKCVSADEARTRLSRGRALSALLAGADVMGLDRDLIDAAGHTGTPTIVVDAAADRDWADLGVAAVLDPAFDRHELLTALRSHATPIDRVGSRPTTDAPDRDDSPTGRLVAVTGPGGTGASVAAMAIAQAFAAEATGAGAVLLADFCLDAEQGMLHDAREVMPGLQELTDAHRAGRLPADLIRSLTFEVVDRGYHLLLGLRRHRDWTAIRPRALAAAVDGLLGCHATVIADVDADIEGESATGSADVEDRNAIARTTLERADLVVVVGNATVKGFHSMTRVIRELERGEVAGARILPAIARAPRNPRRRAEATSTLGRLLGDVGGLSEVGNPVFMSDRSDVEDSIRDGVALPAQLGRPIHAEIRRRLEAAPSAPAPAVRIPEAVRPGSIGTWTEASA